ncbi:hypothetical protein V6N13_087567 [Hibiscus sabdariffa]|uniref:Transmembrane 9 superfamily member n=1 Tax=Hibiscus sabdariffa TaxID=183260 RepID=A0ABR2FWR0_9ROSI
MERTTRACLVALAVASLCCIAPVTSTASDHRYKAGDEVPFFANKVGPFRNPSETYRYFDFPFCSSAPVKEKKEALGEVLNGDRLVSAPYKIDFLSEKDAEIACKKKLSKEEVAKFRTSVSEDYYFQMYFDDLPIWGFFGQVDKDSKDDPSKYEYYLYNHLLFDIFYNKDHVVEIHTRVDHQAVVHLTGDEPVDVDFMYTVKWKETNTPFEKRMDRYSMSTRHLQIQWFSTINSCVIVLLLTAFLATILMRILKNDFMKYTHDEESADEEETGWKYIHGDVFRYPKHKSLFAAALGSGTQLFTMAIFFFILAIVGVFYPYNRGVLLTTLVVIYALTSGIAGYTAASFYCQLEGTNWVRNLLLTGSLFCGPLFVTFCFLNTIATAYKVTAALPFGTIVVIFLIWALVSTPLLVLGGIAGKNSKAEFEAPCHTTKCPREIPQLPWYRKTLPQMAMAGFLPFSAIYIELYYTMTGGGGPSFVVGQLGCSYMPTVCITIIHDQTCQASCKPHFSLDIWLAFAMASSSCLVPLASVHLCSLSVTFTAPSSVSRRRRKFVCLQEREQIEASCSAWFSVPVPSHDGGCCADDPVMFSSVSA